MSTGIIHNKQLIYINNCSDAIYIFNFETEKIRKTQDNLFQTNGYTKFCKMIAYNDLILMIPMFEKFIYSYNVNSKSITRIPLDFVSTRCDGYPRFRDGVLIGSKLCLLPNSFPYLVWLDLLNGSITTTRFPNDATDNILESDPVFPFVNIDIEGDIIYLFKGSARNSFTLDADERVFHLLIHNTFSRYSCVFNNTIICAPSCAHEDFLFIDKNTGDVDRRELDICLKQYGEIHILWHICKLPKKILVCPYNSNWVLVIDKETLNIDYIDIQCPTTIWDAIEFQKSMILFDNAESRLFIIDENNNVKRKDFEIDIQKVFYDFSSETNSFYYNEDYQMSIESLIRLISMG